MRSIDQYWSARVLHLLHLKINMLSATWALSTVFGWGKSLTAHKYSSNNHQYCSQITGNHVDMTMAGLVLQLIGD